VHRVVSGPVDEFPGRYKFHKFSNRPEFERIPLSVQILPSESFWLEDLLLSEAVVARTLAKRRVEIEEQ
jgi:hypothetical protein